MIGLKYATLANEKHSIMVKTWFEVGDSAEHYQFTIDGKVISEGSLADVDPTTDA